MTSVPIVRGGHGWQAGGDWGSGHMVCAYRRCIAYTTARVDGRECQWLCGGVAAAMVDPTAAAMNRPRVKARRGGAMTCIFTWRPAGQSDATYFRANPAFRGTLTGS